MKAWSGKSHTAFFFWKCLFPLPGPKQRLCVVSGGVGTAGAHYGGAAGAAGPQLSAWEEPGRKTLHGLGRLGELQGSAALRKEGAGCSGMMQLFGHYVSLHPPFSCEVSWIGPTVPHSLGRGGDLRATARCLKMRVQLPTGALKGQEPIGCSRFWEQGHVAWHHSLQDMLLSRLLVLEGEDGL